MADEARDVVGVSYYEDHVKVCRLYEEVADGNGIEELSCCEAALDNGEAERVAEQEESLLEAEGAEEDAAVGMVLHGLCHEGVFGGGGGKLCVGGEGDGEVARLQGESSPATGRKVARLQGEK